jgi:hypothetical protein
MNDEELTHYRNSVFSLQLLSAAEEAGLAPLPVMRFHTLAYLANVLSTVWNIPVVDGKILKRKSTPFYPNLQKDLDRLVGIGMVEVSEVSHVQDKDDNWSLEGSFRLNHKMSSSFLRHINEYRDEKVRYDFLVEIAYALTSLSDNDIDIATTQDASYSDPVIGIGNVLDFGEWNTKNYSANAAYKLKEIMAEQGPATPGEAIHMYINHIDNRLNARR